MDIFWLFRKTESFSQLFEKISWKKLSVLLRRKTNKCDKKERGYQKTLKLFEKNLVFLVSKSTKLLASVWTFVRKKADSGIETRIFRILNDGGTPLTHTFYTIDQRFFRQSSDNLQKIKKWKKNSTNQLNFFPWKISKMPIPSKQLWIGTVDATVGIWYSGQRNGSS